VALRVGEMCALNTDSVRHHQGLAQRSCSAAKAVALSASRVRSKALRDLDRLIDGCADTPLIRNTCGDRRTAPLCSRNASAQYGMLNAIEYATDGAVANPIAIRGRPAATRCRDRDGPRQDASSCARSWNAAAAEPKSGAMLLESSARCLSPCEVATTSG